MILHPARKAAMIGKKLGAYAILEKVGSGGMGDVYRAEDSKLARDVAIKVLRDELTADPTNLKRFEREARAASALNHPNIVHIYDIDSSASPPYIAMEYVAGGTLRDLLQGEPLPVDRMLDLATQTAAGLAKAHSAGIVHRDLKPENLTVTSDGYVKILDFGLAKLRGTTSGGGPGSQTFTLTGDLTAHGAVAGTLSYMSPEQAIGIPVDHRSDQFSFGIILFELSTGQHPFRGETPAKTVAAILAAEPPPLSGPATDLPVEFAALVQRCLAKDPAGRFDSTEELVQQLRRLADRVRTRAETEFPSGTRSEQPTIRSVAVLPLANMGPDDSTAFFADGMTEALIGALARAKALKVISRTSIMKYRDTTKSLAQIAGELGVDAVIEGSVLYAGERVRISVHLIEAATEQHLWATTYDGDLRDALALLSDASRAVVEEVSLKLSPREGALFDRRAQVDPKAHVAYLKARHFWNRRTKADLKRSVRYFKQAIDEDPTYAPAYAGLADAYNMMGNLSVLPPGEAFPLAKQAALQALDLDGGLADAHASVAAARAGFDWDFDTAADDFRKAIELNPSHATARQWYAELRAAQGALGDAVKEVTVAQELDPMSSVIRATAAFIHYLTRDFDRAIRKSEEALELDPDFVLSHVYLGLALEQKQLYERSIAEFETAHRLSGDDPDMAAHLARAHALFGDREKSKAMLKDLVQRYESGYVAAYSLALVHIGLGDVDQAFHWLQKACDERSDAVLFIKAHPVLDALREDPRMEHLVQRIGREVSRS